MRVRIFPATSRKGRCLRPGKRTRHRYQSKLLVLDFPVRGNTMHYRERLP